MKNTFLDHLKEKWQEIEKIHSVKNEKISGVELLIFQRNNISFYLYINDKSLPGVLIKSKDKFFFKDNF